MGWKKIGSFEIVSGKMYVGDAMFVPEPTGLEPVELPVGNYDVQIHFGSSMPIHNMLRVSKAGTKPMRGDKIGETWADTGTHGVCDFEAITAKLPNREAEEDFVERMTTGTDDWGEVAAGDMHSEKMVWCSTGSGDGDFEVYELIESGARCGIEIYFFDPEEWKETQRRHKELLANS